MKKILIFLIDSASVLLTGFSRGPGEAQVGPELPGGGGEHKKHRGRGCALPGVWSPGGIGRQPQCVCAGEPHLLLGRRLLWLGDSGKPHALHRSCPCLIPGAYLRHLPFLGCLGLPPPDVPGGKGFGSQFTQDEK